MTIKLDISDPEQLAAKNGAKILKIDSNLSDSGKLVLLAGNYAYDSSIGKDSGYTVKAKFVP